MNYFAHGRHFVHDPYYLSGTAIPDWLNVVDRRVRVRSKHAQPFVDDLDPHVAALARGVVQHHHDDQWFHQTRAFTELSLRFAVEIRDILKPDDGFRPSFLGHILVELLLDAVLIEQNPEQLDEYYAAIDAVDPSIVTSAVSRISGREVNLTPWIPRFSSERFLYDYSHDAKLLTRLNHVMRRVQLPALPASLLDFFTPAREAVRDRQNELLAGSSPPSSEPPSTH